MSVNDSTIDRRRFIRFGGLALATATAGCTGLGGDGGDSQGEPAPEPSLAVTNVSVSETAIYTDETLEVTAAVANEGGVEGTFHAELRMDGVIVETQAVTVPAGETEPVTFTGSFSEPSEYEVAINDGHAGTVRVELPPPEFELVEAAIDETTVAVGEAIAVDATIENVGGREGTFTADLQADGQSLETEALTIDSDETESITLTHAFDDSGEYEVGLSGVTIETVTVERPAAFEIEATSIAETSVGVGEEVDVAARIANTGEQAGTVRAELEANGEGIATSDGEIAGGETATAYFSVSFEERGAYDLRVSIAEQDPAGNLPASGDSAGVDTLYVTECYVAVSETVTVDSGSSTSYVFDLEEHVEVGIEASTRGGVDPTLTISGPSETVVDEVSVDSISGSVTTREAGRHEISFENDAVLPLRDGTWAIEIEICTWA